MSAGDVFFLSSIRFSLYPFIAFNFVSTEYTPVLEERVRDERTFRGSDAARKRDGSRELSRLYE